MALPIGPVLPPELKHLSNSESNGVGVSAKSISIKDLASQCLLQRFGQLRRSLKDPSLLRSSRQMLDLDLPTNQLEAYNLFKNLVGEMPPSPTLLVSCTLDTIYQLLEISTRIIKHGVSEQNLGAWIWALLARVPGIGELNNDDVSIIRNLGKEAIKTGRRLIEGHGGKGVLVDGDAYDRSRRNTSSPPPDDESETDQSILTVDIIVLIVGECFGQKDLQLEWDEARS
jgi:hypothetical protein